MAKTRKPLILSTRMATIREAVRTAKKPEPGTSHFKMCQSYPANPKEMNLRTIPDLQKRFRPPVGLFDHTLGIGTAVAAAVLGASLIEKHFTRSRRIKAPDSFLSMEPDELKALVMNVRLVEDAIGRVHYGLTQGERKRHVFRRSLLAAREIFEGEKITEDHIRSISPAFGIPPKYFRKILNKKAVRHISSGTPLRFSHVVGASRF